MKITEEDVLVRCYLNDIVAGEFTAPKVCVSQSGVSIWANSKTQGKMIAMRDHTGRVVVEFSQRTLRGGVDGMAIPRLVMGVPA